MMGVFPKVGLYVRNYGNCEASLPQEADLNGVALDPERCLISILCRWSWLFSMEQAIKSDTDAVFNKTTDSDFKLRDRKRKQHERIITGCGGCRGTC